MKLYSNKMVRLQTGFGGIGITGTDHLMSYGDVMRNLLLSLSDVHL